MCRVDNLPKLISFEQAVSGPPRPVEHTGLPTVHARMLNVELLFCEQLHVHGNHSAFEQLGLDFDDRCVRKGL
jgi:hypothetical protein